MDVLSDICKSIRLEGSIFYRSDLTAPWGMILPAASEPRFHVVLEGELWFQTDKMPEPQLMQAGDVLIIPEGEWHWIADSIGSECVNGPDAREALIAGKPMFQGDSIDTRLLCGLFRFDKTLEHPLISALPDIIQLHYDPDSDKDFLKFTVDWIFSEFNSEAPGANVLIDRLCEILFIQSLRNIQDLEKYANGFLIALKDPRINKALQLIHSHPEKAWTLEALAAEVAMSRAVFADHFVYTVGCPPISYLTSWRMRNALNLLKETNLSAQIIAEKVGYQSNTSFSRAFQRHFGLSPLEYRKKPEPL